MEMVTASMTPQMITFPPRSPVSPSAPKSSGIRFCCTALVARLYWGRDQTMLAMRLAMAQAHPKRGLTCRLMA